MLKKIVVYRIFVGWNEMCLDEGILEGILDGIF